MIKQLSFKILFFLFPICLSAHTNLSQQEKWDIKSAEVETITDRLGLPIDEKIKETITALNIMGINTDSSCEGHLHWGDAHPWIHIATTQEIEDLWEKYEDLDEQVNDEYTLLSVQHPSLHPNDLYESPEGEKLFNLNERRLYIKDLRNQKLAENVEPLHQLLDQFYKHHKTTYDRILIAESSMLRSIGADRQQLRSPDEQAIKLKEYQQEMEAFTLFLKQKFLNESFK